MSSIQSPFVTDDTLPGIDFNREIVEPGMNETFPDGCVGIRVDDDFWAVAALPLSYRDTPLPDLVRALWPHYADQADFTPDHGTMERQVFRAEGYAEDERKIRLSLDKDLQDAKDEIERLREGRPAPEDHHSTARRRFNKYFIDQYEHLLIAMAHANEPFEDEWRRGICQRCGLLGSDRMHSKRFLDLHAKGYEPTRPWWRDEPRQRQGLT